MPSRRVNIAGAAIAFGTSLAVQLLLYGRYLDDAVTNGHSDAGDAHEYVALAQAWLDHGFSVAFANVARNPATRLIWC